MATFDGNRRIVAFGGAVCIGNFIGRDTLNDGAAHIDDEMGAHISICLCIEIISVIFCGCTGIGNIVDNNAFDRCQLISRTGSFPNGEIIFGDELFHCFVGNICRGDSC